MPKGLWPQGSGVRIPSLTLLESKGCRKDGALTRRKYCRLSSRVVIRPCYRGPARATITADWVPGGPRRAPEGWGAYQSPRSCLPLGLEPLLFGYNVALACFDLSGDGEAIAPVFLGGAGVEGGIPRKTVALARMPPS
jgi:hypothetical protein